MTNVSTGIWSRKRLLTWQGLQTTGKASNSVRRLIDTPREGAGISHNIIVQANLKDVVSDPVTSIGLHVKDKKTISGTQWCFPNPIQWFRTNLLASTK